MLILRRHEALPQVTDVAAVEVIEQSLFSAAENGMRTGHMHRSGRSEIEIAHVQVDRLISCGADEPDDLELACSRIMTKLRETVGEVARPGRGVAVACHRIDQPASSPASPVPDCQNPAKYHVVVY